MNDGGPAFPVVPRPQPQLADGTWDQTWESAIPGVSKLDYFAAAALQGMLSSDKTIDAVARLAKSGGTSPEEYIASMAYGYASAMLHWKEKRG